MLFSNSGLAVLNITSIGRRKNITIKIQISNLMRRMCYLVNGCPLTLYVICSYCMHQVVDLRFKWRLLLVYCS